MFKVTAELGYEPRSVSLHCLVPDHQAVPPFLSSTQCARFCMRGFPGRRRKNPSLWFQANHPLPWDVMKKGPSLLLLQQLGLQVTECSELQVSIKCDPFGNHLWSNYHAPGSWGHSGDEERLHPQTAAVHSTGHNQE